MCQKGYYPEADAEAGAGWVLRIRGAVRWLIGCLVARYVVAGEAGGGGLVCFAPGRPSANHPSCFAFGYVRVRDEGIAWQVRERMLGGEGGRKKGGRPRVYTSLWWWWLASGGGGWQVSSALASEIARSAPATYHTSRLRFQEQRETLV